MVLLRLGAIAAGGALSDTCRTSMYVNQPATVFRAAVHDLAPTERPRQRTTDGFTDIDGSNAQSSEDEKPVGLRCT